jgi:hypothetical protein
MDAVSLSVPVGGVLGKAEGRVRRRSRRMFAFSALAGAAAREEFPIISPAVMAETAVSYQYQL